jgi:hypothetical protein
MKTLITIPLALAVVVAGAQTTKQSEIPHVATSLNHLTVLQFGEPVTKLALADPDSFRVESHDDTVLIEPLREGMATNLLVWTPSRQLSYELDPAGQLAAMDVVIRNDPPPDPHAKARESAEASDAEMRKIASLVLAQTMMGVQDIGHDPVKVTADRVQIDIEQIYRSKDQLYIRYSVTNKGNYILEESIQKEDDSPSLPYGLVSLSDMMHKFRASTLMTITWTLQNAAVGWVDGQQSDEKVRRNYATGLEQLDAECKHAGLNHVCDHIKVIQRLLKPESSVTNLTSQVTTLLAVLQTTLAKTLVFRLDDESANLLVEGGGLTPEAADAFPSAWRELGHSARCLAFDQSTACVFHAMRAIEFPLQALTVALNVVPSNPNWDTAIRDCEKAIRELGNPPNTRKGWKEDKHFYSEAAVNFRYFKDAYRNHAMHGKVSYERRDAKEIMEHSTSFVQHLSPKLKEDL